MGTAVSPFVTHSAVRNFAENSANLSREDAKEYRDAVNRLRDKVHDFIADHPDAGLEKTLLFGSLAKGTALKTLHDIDVAVYIRNDDAPVDDYELLNWLAKRIREAYPQMDPSQITVDEYCVTVSYNSLGIDVDLVPVRYKGDPDDRGYLFTPLTTKRVLTSVSLQNQFIRKRKDQQPNKFAQVIRLLKWWTKQRKRENASFELMSFMAEMIVAKLADDGVVFADYTDSLETVFTYIVRSQLKERIAFTDNYKLSELPAQRVDEIEIFDPVNPENNKASAYTSHQRTLIVEAAEDSLDALAEARFSTTKERAVDCWKIVLGPSFQG